MSHVRPWAVSPLLQRQSSTSAQSDAVEHCMVPPVDEPVAPLEPPLDELLEAALDPPPEELEEAPPAASPSPGPQAATAVKQTATMRHMGWMVW